MAYTEFSLKVKNKKLKINPWNYVEGVILYPNGMWVARVKEHRTLSQHTTQEGAEKVYTTFQKWKNKDFTDISDLTSKEIVNLVKNVTGEQITFSLKSKKSIINKANKILNTWI